MSKTKKKSTRAPIAFDVLLASEIFLHEIILAPQSLKMKKFALLLIPSITIIQRVS